VEFLILIAVFGLMMWMMSRGAKKQRQAAVEVPDDASSLTRTDEPVVTDERPGDESDERRA